MLFNLKRPCADCPFRTDRRPYLTVERARDIAEALSERTFTCHKTLDYHSGQPRDTDKSAHCAGALIMMENEERPGQMMRIAERLGLYDHHSLDMTSPVYEDRAAFIEAHEEQETALDSLTARSGRSGSAD